MVHVTLRQVAVALGSALGSLIVTLLLASAGGFIGWLLVGANAQGWSVVIITVTVVSLAASSAIAWSVYKVTGALWATALVLLAGGGVSIAFALSAFLGF